MAVRFRPQAQFLMPFHRQYAITVSRAAQMLDCDESTVRRMIESGEIEAYKKRPDRPNSPFHVSYDSVMKHIEKIHQTSGLEPRF